MKMSVKYISFSCFYYVVDTAQNTNLTQA